MASKPTPKKAAAKKPVPVAKKKPAPPKPASKAKPAPAKKAAKPAPKAAPKPAAKAPAAKPAPKPVSKPKPVPAPAPKAAAAPKPAPTPAPVAKVPAPAPAKAPTPAPAPVPAPVAVVAPAPAPVAAPKPVAAAKAGPAFGGALTVSVQTSQGAAASGNTHPANILVIVTCAGVPVVELSKDHFTLMEHFEVPGQGAPFSNNITSFRNAGTGAYLLQIKPITGAPWRTGHHLGQILISDDDERQGQAAFKMIIR